MTTGALDIEPVRIWDLLQITRMSYNNMTGVDPQFSTFARNPLLRLFGYVAFPIYFALAGRGQKAVMDEQIAGYAFLYLRELSGIIFNVGVNQQFRRRGVAHALLDDLERRVQRRRIPWAALQVDRHNLPARTLYEKRDYSVVNPYYWTGSVRAGPIAAGVQVMRLPARQGRILYQRYHILELKEGESWAADVLRREYLNLPSGGKFWRCLVYGEEIGAAWTGSQQDERIIQLALRPEYWTGELVLQSLIRQLTSYNQGFEKVGLLLGSSAHHLAAAPNLRALGLAQQEQARLLMLKRLALGTHDRNRRGYLA